MAYQRQKARLLAGSMNLLVPADLLPEGDARRLQGFRSDQQGALRSRLGSALVNTAGSNPIRSLIKSLGIRYQGSDELFRNFSSIESGFSGNPMGLVDAAKWLWVMDQSKRRKDDGTTDYQWHIDKPTDPPTAGSPAELTEPRSEERQAGE